MGGTALLLLAIIGFGGRAQEAPVETPADPAICSALVQAALESTDALCGDTSRNQACYGHVLNEATFRVDRALTFEAQGDKAALDHIQTLDLSPLDLDLEQWGVVLLQAQANLPASLPGQNVTFILFGDVEVDNAIGGTVEVPAQLRESARIRIAPGAARAVIASLTPDIRLFASGKYFNADGELWVRVGQAVDTQAFGWVEASVLETDLDLLPNLQPGDDSLNPMQAFYFKTGIGRPQCVQAPRDGMIIQTPRGVGKIDFTVNGIDVKLGSTAYVTSPLDTGNTCVSLLTGEAELESDDVTMLLRPGQRSCVRLDENGIADGPPGIPDSFDPAEINLLNPVLELLPDDVVIPNPAPSNTPTNTRVPPTPSHTPTMTPTFTAEPPAATAVPTNTRIPRCTATPEPLRDARSDNCRTPRPTRTPSLAPALTLSPTPLPPVAAFSYSISARDVTFSDESTNAPTTVDWDFGDSTAGSGPNPLHTYPDTSGSGIGEATYSVQLTVCNAGGCDSASQTVIIPNCNFDPGQSATINFLPGAGIGYSEAFGIHPKDAHCNAQSSVGMVTFYGGASVTGFKGQHFYAWDNMYDCLHAVYVITGPQTFEVGPSACAVTN